MEFIPSEKAVPIREASTANLLIDSIDRLNPDGTEKNGESSANFTIQLNQSIMNGYFTRLAVSEVVLDWCVDNISAGASNNTFTVEIPVGSSTLQYTVTMPDGQYTVKQALDQLIALLNTAASPYVFSLTTDTYTGLKNLHLVTGSGSLNNFRIYKGNLQTELNLKPSVYDNDFPINCPLLLPYTYIDFVSNSLTYNQALKDATTNSITRNVLYRWYFANDNVPQTLDAYGYPIFQGYQRFVIRRVLPFPKQIRWTSNQPIGQLQFQVFSSQGIVLSAAEVADGEMEWSMTLLVSEV